MTTTKHLVSMNNGLSFKLVEELTQSELKLVLDDIYAATNIEAVAKANDAVASCGENDYEWLAMFLNELGENWIVG